MDLKYYVGINDLKNVKKLLQSGANANQKNSSGFTILMSATLNNTPEIIKILIDYGADIDFKTINGSSALSVAVGAYSIESLNILLEYGANVNTVNKNNKSPLLLSTIFGYTKITKLLIQYNADPFIASDKHKIPIDYCTSIECKTILSLQMAKFMNKNIYTESNVYKSAQIPKELWRKILVIQRYKKLCKTLDNESNKYVLIAFAEILDIPVYKNMSKKDLCFIISKHL